MNVPAILEAARKIRENNLPFNFNMHYCNTCIMGVVGLKSLSSRSVANEFGISYEMATKLCYPSNKERDRWKDIPAWQAADTLERLAITGEVKWDWSEPKVAVVVVSAHGHRYA